MLDIRFIRQNPKKVKEGIAKKQVKVDIDRLLQLDEKKREYIQKVENLRAEQNKLGKPAFAKATAGEDNIARAQEIKSEIKKLEPELEKIEKELSSSMSQIPNLPLEDVPVGKDEKDNVVIREEGKRPKFKFQPKDYLEITENLDLIDVKRAAKVTGTRFGYLKREAALLEFALINLAMDVLTKEGFIPVVPPVMISEKAMEGMGYLAHGGEEETYHFEKDKLYFIGTSEQAVGPMHMDEVFEEKELPKRYVGFSACFRREAGAYGKDTKGILRVHQFDKVEMFSFCNPEKSREEHRFLLSLEEKLMKLLKIPYRVVEICTGDLGDPAAAKYDIEAWLPGQNQYRETHSASNATDFQARRLNIRYRDSKTPTFAKASAGKQKLEFVHTLNGTAFAMGRILIAIIENYQQKNGSIKVPAVLQKYLKFKKIPQK